MHAPRTPAATTSLARGRSQTATRCFDDTGRSRLRETRDVLREWNVDVERAHHAGPVERDVRGVERVPAERANDGPSVELIAREGVSDRGEVGADLVPQRASDDGLDERPGAPVLLTTRYTVRAGRGS